MDPAPKLEIASEESSATAWPATTAAAARDLHTVDANVVVRRAIFDHIEVIRNLADQQHNIEAVAKAMVRSITAGGKIIWCGNGGSAADSQHLAAELVGRFRRERRGLASIALTTDTSILTAVGNDYGYDQVFSRQVEALCLLEDVVVGISTSGSSRNVCKAIQAARAIGATTIAMTGRDGGELGIFADIAICADAKDTARIQEAHILVGHILCDWIETSISARKSTSDLELR
jgi:D-sedoheptulose 7-phosphate isomerase